MDLDAEVIRIRSRLAALEERTDGPSPAGQPLLNSLAGRLATVERALVRLSAAEARLAALEKAAGTFKAAIPAQPPAPPLKPA